MTQIEMSLQPKLPAPMLWGQNGARSQTVRQLPPNPYNPKSQKGRIYARLARYGRVKNIDILYGLGGPMILNGTGRTSEIRAFLKPYGFNLHCSPVGTGGVYEYEVRP
jgi:hypothetical protein